MYSCVLIIKLMIIEELHLDRDVFLQEKIILNLCNICLLIFFDSMYKLLLYDRLHNMTVSINNIFNTIYL